MHRRSLLAIAGTGVSLSIAGCTALFEASLPDELDGVDRDPDQLPRPTIGSGDVTIDVYEDFGCPSCHEFQADVFPALADRLLADDDAIYRHFDFPLPADDRSIAMANAARAVQDETMTEDDPAGEFFAYKRAVMAADDWSDETLASIAADQTAASEDGVSDALAEDAFYPTLVADWNRGDEDGVDSTPTVLVEGETVDDPLDADAIVEAVDETTDRERYAIASPR